MKAVFVACAAVLVPTLAMAQEELSGLTRSFITVDAPVVALTNANVIDGTGSPARASQTVLIEAGRISEIGPSESVTVPEEATVIDASGHTVIPGLVGLHNHTFYTTSARRTQASVTAPRMYLASGVTTIRTTGSYHPYSELNLKHAIERGDVPGPRMHVTGPYITGVGTAGYMTQVGTPEDARRVVSYWAEEGASWMKAYTGITRAALEAAIDEAHRHGMKFTGHLCSVTFSEAIDLGIDNLEHGFFAATDFDPAKEPDLCPPGSRGRYGTMDLSSPSVARLFDKMIENNVGMTSTLAVYELSVPNRPPIEPRVLEMMHPGARDEYLESRRQIAASAANSQAAEVFRNAMLFEKRFVEAGGLLGAGVDPTGNGGALPGFGDQRNYELLLEAGFTPVEAIRITSLNGARILGVDDDFGSLEEGKVADLVLIEGDIVSDPASIRNVRTVFKGGTGYDSALLLESVRGTVGLQ